MIRYNTKRYWGYSTDTKPVNAQIGDRFLEMDTQLEYVFSDYNKWELIGSNASNFTGGTVSGETIFTNGLTANTISATTYQNLPVSGVTGGTGISANTTNGLVTIVNTAPDQVVTITGGTNININGTYPNFGINFTGSTGASGDFLPLSGGTVSGATSFTGGLTANTISSTTYSNLPISSSATTGVLSSTDWSTFNGKQDRVSGVSDTEISYLDGVTNSIQTQIDNLVELNFLRQNVGYIQPSGLVNVQPGFNVSPNISSWALVLSGNTATGGIGGFVRFDTTATAGTLAFRRGSFGIVLGDFQFEYTQKVRFQTNLTGQRGLWGLSDGYTFASPTNVEPNTNVNVVGVCQLSTSTNLHILHNDGTGTATTVDLGTNYPCNTNIYTYYIRIKRTTADYTITVERITNTDNSSISNVYTTSTNIPVIGVGSFSPINYITNNAQSATASYFDGGCIAKITHQ